MHVHKTKIEKESMKKINKTLLAGLIASGVCGVGTIDSVQAENVRKITVLDDSNLTPMVTRVYDLQHAKAADLTPFVKGAVKRMRPNAGVDRLNFKANGTQHLVVTMDADYTEQIDELIKTLDRPGLVGTGIHNFDYSFKNRTAYGIFNNLGTGKTVVDIFASGDANYHRFDTDTVLWKDSYSDGAGAIKWFKALDVPTPAAQFEFTVYEISEDDIKDIGVDYDAWQQGYKADLFRKTWGVKDMNSGATWQGNGLNANQIKFSDFNFGIDATFLRMLQEKGKAKIMNKATLVLRNHVSPTAVSKFDKFADDGDATDGTSKAVITLDGMSVSIDRVKSTIFNNAEQVNLDFTLTYSVAGSKVNDLEVNQNKITYDCERVKIGYGDENTVFSLSRQHDVKEFVGVPFLSEIPVLKYLFGTETRSKLNVKQFLTIKVKDVTPMGNLSEEAEALMQNVLADLK